MRVGLAALAAACCLLLIGPAIAGPMSGRVLGHAELVTSEPGAGEVVPTSPKTMTLTFGEPFEPAYSNIDLLDGNGATILTRAGVQDPTDPHVITVALPALADGLYTVDWRTVSAADGHSTSGFFTFGVGDVAPPADAGSTGSGNLHAGHGAGLVLLETESRAVADLGFMLAWGVAVAAVVVLRRTGAGAAKAIAWALVLGIAGSLTLAIVGTASTGSPSIDYVVGTRTGLLLIARVAISLVAIVLIVTAIRIGRPRLGIAAGGVAALAGIGLIVAAGHASGEPSPVPVIAAFVHVSAAGIWIGGLAVVAWIGIVGSAPPTPDLRTAVPRFSALALISIGLVAATGIYADQLLTGAPLQFDSDYALALLVKIILVLAALTLGAFNFLDGGRALARFGGFRIRVALEVSLVAAILVATANLASGSPPGLTAPVRIQPAFTSATAIDAGLSLVPGRPGPTRFLVTVAGDPAAVDLDLTRLDTGNGTSRLALRAGPPVAGDPSPTFVTDGGLLPANSRWDATVIARDASGSEIGRSRFTFAMDATGVSEGRAAAFPDLTTFLAAALLLAALILVVFTIAGGVLPRVEARAGRFAALVGSLVAGVLGVVMLLAGRS